MLAVLLLAGILGISAMLPDTQELHFDTKIKQNEHCELCYGTDCLAIDENRCEYYRKTGDVLWDGPEDFEAEDTEVRDTIDGYIMEYVNQDSWIETECIPLVSKYTNCNKENICTGCQTCDCDGMGRWNCTMMERCKPTDIIDFNQTTLAVVLEKIKDYINVLQRKKRKRSITYDDKTEKERMNYEDILKLLYGIQNFVHNHKSDKMETIITPNNTPVNDIDSNIWDAESLRFEELIDYEKNNNLNLYDVTPAKHTRYEYQNKSGFVNLNDTNIGNLNSGRNQINKSDILYVKSVEMPIFDYLNFDDTRNLKKREVILEPKQVQNNASILSPNSSYHIRELKNNVLYPLFNIVNEKQKELEQLMNIKDKFVMYFKSFTDINVTNNYTDSSNKNDNPHIYFYQLEIPTELQDDIRKHNQNILEKYFEKLRRDLFEVIKDIANIKKLSNSTMPQDLKFLVRAIRYYINKEKQINKIIEPKLHTVNLRRRFDADSNLKQSYPTIIFDNIFELLDKNASITKALEPVSKGGKQILKRLIKQIYRNNFESTSSKIFDSQYDITNLLNDIGRRWDKVVASIIKNSASDQLYAMKLLHIEVSADIEKIKLAIELLQTAENRRILLIEEGVGEKMISKIGDDLNKINNFVKQIAQSQVRNRYIMNENKAVMLKNKSELSGTSLQNKSRKKKSFLQTIKKLLRSSKKDIRDLFHKKVPKSDIIKHIAKNKIDEITKNKLSEYEETMRRWQNNLNVRNKRSAGDIGNFFNRLKNIIPEYLRGKVKPAVHRKKSNKTVGVEKRHSNHGHKINKRIKPKSTTPGMYVHR